MTASAPILPDAVAPAPDDSAVARGAALEAEWRDLMAERDAAAETLSRMRPRWAVASNGAHADTAVPVASEEGIERIAEQARAEIEKLQSRLDVARYRVALGGRLESMWLRAKVDETMRRTSDEIAALGRAREEAIRDAQLPQGQYHELARRMAERLAETDLIVEDAGDVSTLQLKQETAVDIQQRVVRQMLVDMEEEEAGINDAVARIVSEAGDRVSALMGWDVKFEAPAFSAARAQDLAATAALTPVSFSTEIPRVAGGAFVWNAFLQPAMLAGMLLMPFWILMMDMRSKEYIDKGITRSGLLVYLMAALYPGYVFYQMQKIPRDRKKRIKKEFEKLKQTVRTEVEKSVRTAVEERKRVLGDYWRKVMDEIRQQVGECMMLAGEIKPDAAALEHRVARLEAIRTACATGPQKSPATKSFPPL